MTLNNETSVCHIQLVCNGLFLTLLFCFYAPTDILILCFVVYFLRFNFYFITIFEFVCVFLQFVYDFNIK